MLNDEQLNKLLKEYNSFNTKKYQKSKNDFLDMYNKGYEFLNKILKSKSILFLDDDYLKYHLDFDSLAYHLYYFINDNHKIKINHFIQGLFFYYMDYYPYKITKFKYKVKNNNEIIIKNFIIKIFNSYNLDFTKILNKDEIKKDCLKLC